MAAGTGDDDPFLRSTARTISMKVAGEAVPLTWAAPPETVGTMLGDHVFRLTRTPLNRVVLRETAPRTTADRIRLERRDDVEYLVIEGRHWTDEPPSSIVWRRYLPGTEEFVDETGDLTSNGTHWTQAVPTHVLLSAPGEESIVDPLANLVDWALFSIRADGEASAVVPEPFLLTTLPLVTRNDERSGLVTQNGTTLHVDINLIR